MINFSVSYLKIQNALKSVKMISGNRKEILVSVNSKFFHLS